MKRGWNEVARLGRKGPKYPHVLVDRRGWCLRLGPNPESDDRYYSGLASLAEGIIEHVMRRGLPARDSVSSLRELVKNIRVELAAASGLARQIPQFQTAPKKPVQNRGIAMGGLAPNTQRGRPLGSPQDAGGH